MTFELKPSPLHPIIGAMADSLAREPWLQAVSFLDVYYKNAAGIAVVQVGLNGPYDFNVGISLHLDGGADGILHLPLRELNGRLFGGAIVQQEIKSGRIAGALPLPIEHLLCGGITTRRPIDGLIGPLDVGLFSAEHATAAKLGKYPFRPLGDNSAAVRAETRRLKGGG